MRLILFIQRITVLTLFFCISSAADKDIVIHSLELLDEDSELILLLDRLYVSSGELPPSVGSFTTYADARENFERWLEKYQERTALQWSIIGKITIILDRIVDRDFDLSLKSFQPTIEGTIGIDYLYHQNLYDADSVSQFFNVFKDRDFITKYDHRENFIDVRIKSSYWNYFFFSSRFGIKEDWSNLDIRENHYPRDLHELDANFNQKSVFTFRFNPITIISGRDRVTMGLGEHGKLLISHELPPLDVFRFSVKFGKHIRFYDFITPLNNISTKLLTEEMRPKYLLAHRMEFDLTRRSRVSVNEMLILNSYLKWNYLNPFLVFHNVTNANNTNIFTAIDFEVLLSKRVRSYLTIAIDEIDFFAVEPTLSRESRLAMGYHFGTKWYNPLNLPDSFLLLELVKLDKWLYNYDETGDQDLTYTYIETIDYPEERTFYRFIGHYLGSNAWAAFLDFGINRLTLSYQHIEQGEVLLLEPAWSEHGGLPVEIKDILGLQYENTLLDGKISVTSRLFLTHVENFHYNSGATRIYPEFWVSLGYRTLYMDRF